MAQNVLVCCRFRPANSREKNEGAQLIAKIDDSHSSVNIYVENPSLLDDLDPAQKSAANRQYPSFNFDYVFDWNSTQAEVFEHTAKPMVKDIFAGYNATIFAYGQTGSGKSHSMMGKPTEEDKGVIPRLVEEVFRGIEEADEGLEFTVKVSYIEIYNERIRDLLNTQSQGSDNLKVRENQHGVYIEGVTETYVSSHEQVVEIINAGAAHRAQAATAMNAESSRSHSVLIVTLGQVDSRSGSKRGARLTLVDLAGSERQAKTMATGQTLEEAKNINKSLSALGNVINALTSNGNHIPYRDSKLTRLLSDSLGGNSKTCLIITCSPMSTNVDETISTLRFGTRAKMIKNKPKVNQEKSISEYKKLLATANAKIEVQEQIIEALEKDVTALQACLRSVDPQYLKMPIPELRSKDRSKLAPKLDEEGNPISEDKSQTMETPSKPSTASSTASEPLSPSTLSSPSATASPSDSSSPLPSRGSDGTAEDLLSSMPARITVLTLEKAELESQLKDLIRDRDNLQDALQDKEREMEEASEITAMEKDILSLEMKTLMTEMEAERKRRDEMSMKLRESELKVAELGLLKKKVELMERDHQIAVAELTEDKRDLSAKLMEALNEINEKYNAAEHVPPPAQQMPPPQATSPNKQNAQGAGASMAAASMGLTSPGVRAAVGAGSAMGGLDLMSMVKPRTRGGSGSSASAVPFIGADLRGDDSVKIETLTQALQRKCDQYIQLQMAHQNSAEHISMLEVLLAESNARLKEAQDAPNKRIRELEEKLAAAENLCAKLLESGRYWRNERKQKDGPPSPRRVVVPIHAGQKKAPVVVKKDDMSMFF